MPKTYTSVTAAKAVGVNPTTIQRAIKAGELAADVRGTAKQARYVILPEPLAAYAAQNGLTVRNGAHSVDPTTGEVLEAQPTPIERATAARARLAGVALEPSTQSHASAAALGGNFAVADGAAVAEPQAAAESEPVGPQFGMGDYTRRPAPGVAGVTIAEDRLSLLARLVKAGHFEAAQLVVTAWKL